MSVEIAIVVINGLILIITSLIAYVFTSFRSESNKKMKDMTDEIKIMYLEVNKLDKMILQHQSDVLQKVVIKQDYEIEKREIIQDLKTMQEMIYRIQMEA